MSKVSKRTAVGKPYPTFPLTRTRPAGGANIRAIPGVLGKSNVLGVAYTKAAEMADTLQNSGGGSRSPYKGEFGFKGGVIEKRADGYLLAVFSGGKAEDDVAVAQAGLKELGKAMDAGAAGKRRWHPGIIDEPVGKQTDGRVSKRQRW